MVKEREVAFLKTTGEAIFTLRFQDPSPKIGDKTLQVWVRRPKAGQNGIEHVEEIYFVDELESYDEQRKRFKAEREELINQYGPKTTTETPSFSA